MFIAKDSLGNEICAHCGKHAQLTKDHFIPKSCRMTVNEEGNYVGMCKECNEKKADHIVLPSWYKYLSEGQYKCLCRYMRYTRSYIIEKCNEKSILEFLNTLIS